MRFSPEGAYGRTAFSRLFDAASPAARSVGQPIVIRRFDEAGAENLELARDHVVWIRIKKVNESRPVQGLSYAVGTETSEQPTNRVEQDRDAWHRTSHVLEVVWLRQEWPSEAAPYLPSATPYVAVAARPATAYLRRSVEAA
jgi:hypothetical protein